MKIKQFYLACLAHASYVVFDEKTKKVAVIDPQRDIDQYIEEAEKLGASIDYVILTHFHADFIAGHLELRDRCGAEILLGAAGKAEYDFQAVRDGDVIEFGDVRLSILETPGHTPEGISIVATDLAADPNEPVAVFTGDTLFVGDVGRPDLLASVGVSASDLAGWLYDSLHEKLMKLPDATTVYPAHGAGSLCGKNLGKETFTTIGEQRRSNYALQPMTKAEFEAIVTAEQPAAPAYFIHDATMNKKERQTLESSMSESLKGLGKDELLAHQRNGVRVLDVRAAADFAKGHVPGSLNVGLDGSFATWAGTLIAPRDAIVLVADPGQEREAAMRLGRIGLDHVVGYLEGGVSAMGGGLATLDETRVADLAKRLEEGGDRVVLDVRTAREYGGGHIEDAVNIPLNELQDRIADVPKGKPISVVCRSGYRSSAASSVLLANGVDAIENVLGGMNAWTEAALPIAATAGASCGTTTGSSCSES